MLVEQVKFKAISSRNLGFVILGALCTTDDVIEAWAQPVLSFLKDEAAVTEKATVETLWESLRIVTTKGGRTDLVFTFNDTGMEYVDMSRLVIVRLQMPDMSWIEYWKVNNAKDF